MRILVGKEEGGEYAKDVEKVKEVIEVRAALIARSIP